MRRGGTKNKLIPREEESRAYCNITGGRGGETININSMSIHDGKVAFRKKGEGKKERAHTSQSQGRKRGD